MYRKITDFLSDYQAESKNTLATINAISNEFLNSRVDPKGMSLGELVFHITQAIEKITTQLGFHYSPSVLEMEAPCDVKGLTSSYERTVLRLTQIMESKSDDSFLEKTYQVYNSTWSVSYALSVLVKHEIHHRGQLILGLRAVGQEVPDIYGPARKRS